MENYSVRNLSSSLQTLNQNLIKQKAIEIVKYQNFKTKIAMQKMNCKMARQVFDSAVGYIRYKTHNPTIVTKSLKDAIDEAINNHIQPLTPREEEKRQMYAQRSEAQRLIKQQKKYQAKDAEVPIAKLELIKQPTTETFDYGVKVGDNIRIFDSEDSAKEFFNNLKFFCNEAVQLVEVKFNEVK